MLNCNYYGQIVIDIPSRKTRRFVVTDEKRAERLLSTLEETAIIVKGNPPKLTKKQLDSLRDQEEIESAGRSWKNYQRNGKGYTVDELRKKYGL